MTDPFFGPERAVLIAQAVRPGNRLLCSSALKGPFFSVPNIPFVPFNHVTTQPGAELVLE
jgi:hypothetical protein